MSTTRLRLQRNAPQIRTAGLAGDYTQPGVAELTSSYNPEGVLTPTKIKVHYHRGGDVGIAHRHWGLSGDAPADVDTRYGVQSDANQRIDECLHPGMYANKMNVLVDEQREKRYVSNIQRPLGRAPSPKDPIVEPLHGFGTQSVPGESVKSLLTAFRDANVAEAGAQTNRHYDWEAKGIDPTQHRFGVASPQGDSSAATFKPPNATRLIPKLQKDYKSTVEYEVGKPRSYGFDNPGEWDPTKVRVPDGITAPFSVTGGGPGDHKVPMRELLSSWAMGAATTGDEEGGLEDHARGGGKHQRRLSGVNGGANGTSSPSWMYRTSTERMRDGFKSLDCRGRTVVTLREGDMDDEARVSQLVNPCHYVSLGVESKYFAGGRDCEDIRRLCRKCDFDLTDAQIDEVFAATAEGGKCGVEQFKNAAVAKGYL